MSNELSRIKTYGRRNQQQEQAPRAAVVEPEAPRAAVVGPDAPRAAVVAPDAPRAAVVAPDALITGKALEEADDAEQLPSRMLVYASKRGRWTKTWTKVFYNTLMILFVLLMAGLIYWGSHHSVADQDSWVNQIMDPLMKWFNQSWLHRDLK